MTKFCACLLKKEEAKLIIESVYMIDVWQAVKGENSSVKT